MESREKTIIRTSIIGIAANLFLAAVKAVNALFANHSAMVKGEHLLELLLRNGEHVTVLYTPEHGIPYVREAIRAGKSAREIRSMWRRDVESFIEKSKPYLLYERKER